MTARQLVATLKRRGSLPALFAPDAKTAKRTLEFSVANIRNPNTRKAYLVVPDEVIWRGVCGEPSGKEAI